MDGYDLLKQGEFQKAYESFEQSKDPAGKRAALGQFLDHISSQKNFTLDGISEVSLYDRRQDLEWILERVLKAADNPKDRELLAKTGKFAYSSLLSDIGYEALQRSGVKLSQHEVDQLRAPYAARGLWKPVIELIALNRYDGWKKDLLRLKYEIQPDAKKQIDDEFAQIIDKILCCPLPEWINPDQHYYDIIRPQTAKSKK